jgi:predicted DNA-binding helix-hairpin-helix protein
MNKKTPTQQIIDTINDMSESQLVELNNDYCTSASYHDDEIHTNDEDFFSTYFENDVIGAVRAASYGNYSYSHNYVKFNGYGNLESFSYFSTNDLCENVETMAEYIADNLTDFYQFDIEEIEEEEEEEETEETK